VHSLLATLSLALAAGISATADGTWIANGARLRLSTEKGAVVGRLEAADGPCALPVGAEVLRGTLIEDSLGAQVRPCLLSPSCPPGAERALAVLLVTTELVGGVHAKAPCADGVRSLVLRRPGATEVLEPPPHGERLSHTAQPQLAPDPVLPAGLAASPDAGQPSLAKPEAPAADPLVKKGLSDLAAARFDDALDHFRAAVDLDPRRAEAYAGVGFVHWVRRDYEEAVAWYKRALEADPRFGDTYYNLACLYAVEGRREMALRYLRLAALNGYSDRKQVEKDPDLLSLRDDPELRAILDQVDGKKSPNAK
jgi:hypothetical protein